MAWYSSLGNVKLSRTNFGFLTLAASCGLAAVDAEDVALLAAFAAVFLTADVGTFLAARFVAFLTTFLTAFLSGAGGAEGAAAGSTAF